MYFMRCIMKKRTKELVVAALIAAIYVALCHFQNLLIPGSASYAIQFRAAEGLMVLAFFTPAAIPGLSLGCLLFNMSFAGALPLDIPVGTAATALSAWLMYATRKLTVKGCPVLGLLIPALCNGVLVGWELSLYMGGGFWLNGVYVAIGELAVLLTLGNLLYFALKKRGLQGRLF